MTFARSHIVTLTKTFTGRFLVCPFSFLFSRLRGKRRSHHSQCLVSGACWSPVSWDKDQVSFRGDGGEQGAFHTA